MLFLLQYNLIVFKETIKYNTIFLKKHLKLI